MIRAVLKHSRLLLFFLFIWLILLINSVHNSYPDEFDNILGGRFFLQGIWPYSGYFAHHAPLGYVFSAIIEIFSGQSFVKFRFLSSLFFLGVMFLTYRVIRQKFILFFFFILAIASTYFWGHMFLADCLSGYLLIPAYGLLFLKMYKDQDLQTKDLVIISGFTAATMLTSTTFMFAVSTVVGLTGIVFLSQFWRNPKILLKKIVLSGVIFSLPYILFGTYLLVTGSLKDFLFDNYTYNSKYYIYNYPGVAANGINPIRYAISIINNFINNYQVLLSRVNQINFMEPFNITLAVGNAALWIYLAVRKKFWLIPFSFLLLAFANVRSNPLNSKVTDYQAAVYFFLSFFNFAFLFETIINDIKDHKDEFVKIVGSFLLIVTGTLWFYTLTFLGAELWRMSYNRYMGQMPLIYDRPQVAPIVNQIVDKNSYCWIGPFEFEENFYLNCRRPSKYTWILPQYANSPEIQKELLAQYSAKKPDVIVYNRNFSAFFQSSDYNKFFINGFLDGNYFLLKDVPGFKNARFKTAGTQNFTFAADFNFRKDIAPELVRKLIQRGLVEVD